MKNVTTYVGIDAHKKDLFVAMLIGNEPKPVTWQLANEPNAVRRLVRKLEGERSGPVRVFSEAGPCGYALQRQVTTTSRITCDVVAPALIPRKPGERVKTNRRDARKLAELGRAGLLTAVQPPTPEDEAVRDLARARDDAREDLQRNHSAESTPTVGRDFRTLRGSNAASGYASFAECSWHFTTGCYVSVGSSSVAGTAWRRSPHATASCSCRPTQADG
jgi:Transposase